VSVDTRHKNAGGETPGQRETMDRFTKHLVENGADHNYARRKAREMAIRMDHRLERENN
jgi:hypothetical protein